MYLKYYRKFNRKHVFSTQNKDFDLKFWEVLRRELENEKIILDLN